MKTHTPGPWAADQYGLIYTGKNRLHIAKAITTGMGQAADANARLLAAAPALLASLEKLVRAIDRAPANFADGLADEARAVIAQAKGEQA